MKPIVSGYACLWDSVSCLAPMRPEACFPGPNYPGQRAYRIAVSRFAFSSALMCGPPVPAVVDHDRAKIFAHTADGTLWLAEDATGLRFEAAPGGDVGQDLVRDFRGGRLPLGASFSFTPLRWEWTRDRDVCRVLEVGELIDVSLCVNVPPACSATIATIHFHDPLARATGQRWLTAGTRHHFLTQGVFA